MKNIHKILIPISTLLIMSTVNAATATGNLKSTAKLNASCVVGASNVAFGQLNIGNSGDAFSSSNITVKCTNQTAYKVGIMNSLVPANTGMMSAERWSINGWVRRMTAGVDDAHNNFEYNLFQDASHTKVFGGSNAWGQGNFMGDVVFVQKTSTGIQDTIPVYGALRLNQFVRPGNYSDTLMVTVDY